MTAYTAAVFADSPIYYFTLNETGGDSTNQGSADTSNTMRPTGLSSQSAAGGFTNSGTAWQFNGTTSSGQAVSNMTGLSGLSSITVEVWCSLDSYSNSSDKLMLELGEDYSASTAARFFVDPNSGTTFDFGTHRPAGYWLDDFTRPSAATWHHFVFVFDVSTPVNKAYIDGSLQSLSTNTHNAGSASTFDAVQLTLMSRNGSSLLNAGKMQHLAIYSGELSSGRVAAHFTAASGAAPVADFTGTPTTLTSGGSVVFTDASTNTPTSWLWEKNSGSGWVNFAGSPTSQNPTETFT